MDNDIEKLLGAQIKKLPREVVTFISSANWDSDAEEIGSLYNLSREELPAFKREVSFVLAGLTHPDEFSSVLEKEVGIKGAMLEALVANVEKKIFTPVRSALVEFLSKEDAKTIPLPAVEETVVLKEPPTTKQIIDVSPEEPLSTKTLPLAEELSPTAQMWGKISGAAPDNLPIAEEISPLFPQIQGKPKLDEDVDLITHPFEEKMKQIFTGGQQKMEDFAIEPTTPAPTSTAPAQQQPKAPPIYHTDPYREAIE